MTRISRWRVAMIVVVAAVAVGACSGAVGSTPAPSADPASPPTTALPPSPEPVELTIFAAASLRGALEAAVETYLAANPGTTIVLSTDSSAALATQIGEGAPADLFLSADTSNPQKLIDAGLADGDAVVFAGNELTVIVPSDDPAGLTTPADLARPGVRIIAAGDEVPISRYAGQLVERLAAEPGYPTGFADAYTANVVSKEDNVKAVVAKVELGEGDAGIVYVTDAVASDKVDTLALPAGVNVPAAYAGVVVAGSEQVAAARAFLEWLAGPDGAGVLASFGFLPPPP